MAAHEAQVMWRGFNRTGDAAKVLNDDLLFSLTNQALVIVCKFLEVWDDFGRLAKTDPRVVPTRRAAQPIIDRIKVWKGLDDLRNTTLAHSYLTLTGKLLPPWELQSSNLAPTYHAECILLLQCVVYAVLAILCVFEKEFVPLVAVTGPSGSTPDPGPGIQKGTQIDVTLRPIVSQVDKLLKQECNIVVSGPIAQAFQAAVRGEAA